MAGFFVGHGRHWDFFRQAGQSESALTALFYEAYLTGQANVLARSEDVSLLCEPHRELAIVLLVQGGQLASAYPYAAGGHRWPIDLGDRYVWPNGVEAQLIGSCHGARVVWFDTDYLKNRDRYHGAGGALPFQINGLAYRVWETQFADPEQEARMGGMKAYLPLAGERASADEVQFLSHVEAARPLDFHGIPFDVYTVTLALPDDFPMRLDLLTPRTAAEKAFAAGDRISGVCWLFGRLAP